MTGGKMKRRPRIGIQAKITIMILVAALVPIIIIAVTFFPRFSGLVTADAVSSAQTAAAALTPQISEGIQGVEDSMTELSDTDYFNSIFFGSLEGDVSGLATSDAGQRFQNKMDEILDEGTIRNIRIYTELPEKSGIYDSFGGELFLPDNKVSANYWHGILTFSTSPYLYAAGNYLGVKEKETYGDCAYIYRLVTNYEGEVYNSYLVLYHDSSVYSSILSNWDKIDGSVSYLLTERDAVVATTDEGLSGLYRVNYSDAQEALFSSNSFVEKEIAGRTVYAEYYYIEETNWMMITVIPKNPILLKADEEMTRFVAICAFIIFAVAVFAILVTGVLSQRITRVSKEMQTVKNGVPNPIGNGRTNDEVADLIDSYNYMVDEINTLLEEQKKSAEELRKAEYNSLQAQINPHFLYNTMDMINWMTLQGKNEEASEVIQALAKFYKLTLSRKQDYSTIADELEHAQIYVQLMNMRYDNIIDFVTDVPDELTRYRIPKLTFQPILENAILHGLLEKEERGGTIVLTAWEENDTITILISDDGVGIDPDLLPRILSEKRPGKAKGGNIAVYNIHNRIKLLYGDAYGLSYESQKGCGCDVTITIPKHLGEDAFEKKESL